MNYTHLHLLLNHFPIIGTLIGTVFLLYGIWKGNLSIQQISLTTILLMALIAIPVFLTGEPAEESVENLPGVIKSIIEAHEEASEIAFWTLIAAGFVSLVSLVMQKLQNKIAKTFVALSFLLSVITSGLMIRTGYLGGQIRHTEVRSNTVTNQTIQQNGEKDDEENDK